MTYGVVAFLDILGFSTMVEADARSVDAIHLPRLLEVLASVREAIDTNVFDVRAFSDSIIISTSLAAENILTLVHTVALLQRLCIERGTLVRGGVALGKHYADQHVIYSDALVRAYHIESKLARMPRVVVDRNTLDYFWNDRFTTQAMCAEMDAALLLDRDALAFVHYASSDWLPLHGSCLTQMTTEDVSRTESVLEKLQWLVQYHNALVDREANPELVVSTLPVGFGPVRSGKQTSLARL